MNDLISRTRVIQEILDGVIEVTTPDNDRRPQEAVEGYRAVIIKYLANVPAAQLEAVISKQEYAEFFLGWLEEYRKQSAKLQGRYLPFEVLGWAVSDFRKCFPERPVEP